MRPIGVNSLLHALRSRSTVLCRNATYLDTNKLSSFFIRDTEIIGHFSKIYEEQSIDREHSKWRDDGPCVFRCGRVHQPTTSQQSNPIRMLFYLLSQSLLLLFYPRTASMLVFFSCLHATPCIPFYRSTFYKYCFMFYERESERERARVSTRLRVSVCV